MTRTKRRQVRPATPADAAPGTEPGASTFDARERATLQSVERGEWLKVSALPSVKARYARYATMTLRRLRRT